MSLSRFYVDTGILLNSYKKRPLQNVYDILEHDQFMVTASIDQL